LLSKLSVSALVLIHEVMVTVQIYINVVLRVSYCHGGNILNLIFLLCLNPNVYSFVERLAR